MKFNVATVHRDGPWGREGASPVRLVDGQALTGGGHDAISAPMSEQAYPVTVAVSRPDGRMEQVRVGTAFKQEEGFRLVLGELTLGESPEAYAPRRAAAPAPSGGGGEEGLRFPNYGRSKNAPIVGATEQDLEYYANGSRRSLADPSKSRWHDKERVLLAAIEAELARQRGEPLGGSGGGSDEPPPHGDDEAPF
jgi:hypothetical protein